LKRYVVTKSLNTKNSTLTFKRQSRKHKVQRSDSVMFERGRKGTT